MNKKLTGIAGLLGACILFLCVPLTKAASLQLVPNWGASGVPTNLSMYVYVPDSVVTNPPVLVLLHYWGGGASGVFAEAQAGGIVAAADQYGFIMVVPQRPDCWDANSTQSLTHDGGGDSQGIAQMVRYAITNYNANSNRVYVTGTSCGAMMTEVMLATYPDIFKAGAAFAGQAVGGAWTPITRAPQQWGDIVRGAYPGYSGPRPRVQLWHGTADDIINYSNQVEAIAQWGNVLGLSTYSTSSNMVTILNITNQWIHQVWQDASSNTVLDAWSEINGGHGTDANLNARYVIPFLGLDKAGPLDAGAGGQRARPHLNAARTTFVADNGQLLRGPYTSTEWTGATSYDQIAKMKSLGFNAVHLYGESFDPNYPNAGSTAPGYSSNRIDSIVASTRDLGLYLVITIGNGANNGNYNAAYVTNFWKFYAARYANETHVLFEVQNEPVAWGPPYSSASATPPGAVNMEIATYNVIRSYAPDTPVLLFTYAVLGGTGGANSALTDIHAFNQTVFGNQNAVWTNIAVGFHGYAGAWDTAIAVSNIISAGYPCLMTEFGSGTWGGGPGGLDVEGVANLERLGVSWLTFQYIPPTGVSDDVTKPECYSNRVVNAGLSWTPDYGSFPVIRSVYGNGGYPWTTADYNNNALGGTLRIEAENFDNGGKGVAYYNGNSSNPGGQYRTSETVGIGITSDTGGGYNVGWTAAGDWLEYTMKVSSAGTYNLRLRVAGTSAGLVQLSANATDLTGPWILPNTGGAQTWTTVTKSVFLQPGQQRLRLNILAGGFNLNWIELSPASSGPLADGIYKILNGASGAALGLNTNNVVITTVYSGQTSQQWTLRHIGGGQYQVNSVAKGNSWNTWMGPLHLLAWGWGAGGDSCFIFLPTTNGYYRFFSAGGGASFQPSSDNLPELDDAIYTGAAAQQWAIISPSAPAFPTGFSALYASSTQASLIWNAVVGASSYNVKRSTNSGGPYTTIATGVTSTNFTDSSISIGISYYYVVSAVAGGVESINGMEAALGFPKLAGTIVGTAGSWNNSGNTISNVFDGNLNTYFDAPVANGAWAGLDFGAGASNVITLIRYCPRSGFESRMTGGIFQGANQANFSDAVTLFTVISQPPSGTFTSVNVTNTTAFRYVRFLSPNNGYGNVAEIEFYGYHWSITVPIPTGLIATAISANQINLTWNAYTNTTSYNVKRSTVSGGPYATIVSVATTNFTDTVAVGMKYYYVVSAISSGVETSNSFEATIALPYPWMTQDVGAVGYSGGATYSNAAFTVIGAGADIQGTADAFRFVYVPATGNCAIVARVVSVQNIDPWSKAGVMIRESLNDTSANAFIGVTPGNGVTWQYRGSTGGGTGWNNTNGFVAPCWVKLVRSGTTFIGYRSSDGTNWIQQGTTTISMTSTVYVGLALTSHNSSSLDTAMFDNVTAPGWLSSTVPSVPTGLITTGRNGEATLNWTASVGASSYNVKRSTINGGPYTIVTNVATVNYTDTGLTNGTTYYYVVSASNPAGESANSVQASATPQFPPNLSIAQTETNLTLSWPVESTGFTLQSCTNLTEGNWENVAVPAPELFGNQWRVAIPVTGDLPSVFFRLLK